jgi:ferredoxin
MKIIEPAELNSLFNALKKNGYQLIGPTIQDGVIFYNKINSADDLPIGWADIQDGGKYRLEKRDDNAYFGYVVGAQSWKKFLYPPSQKLWEAKFIDNNLEIIPEKILESISSGEDTKYAFIGVRACELNAIQIQDKIFTKGEYVNPAYKKRRDGIFILAVNCVVTGGTCFCVSMGTGPKALQGFDLSLTEIITDGKHFFLVETGSEKGIQILSEISSQEAKENEIEFGNELIQNAAAKMGRSMNISNIKELLLNNFEHPEWENIASKCLSCANCTMVCPTCFCTTVEDTTDLSGEIAERWQKWDSCFTMDFSYIHGGSIRSSTKSRYRQWMTHKLASWYDQFGSSGCVGCGRCITWCPVGIDITAEVQAMSEIKDMQQVLKKE